MGRPITLSTGPWSDLPLDDVARKAAELGYQGLELDCCGNHFDVGRALSDDGYLANRRDLLERYDLQVHALSAHAIGQAVLDRIDSRHEAILPPSVWGDGDADGVNHRASEAMQNTARAAQQLGVGLVVGFCGSTLSPFHGGYPAATEDPIKAAFALFAERWSPILDVFAKSGVQFALEPHASGLVHDLTSAQLAIASVEGRDELGLNVDPSHLFWQGIDAAEFVRSLPARIYHLHLNDAVVRLNGRNSILSGHLPHGDPRRGWDYRSAGRGGVDFEELIRALNQAGYTGPLCVVCADPEMDREASAKEAWQFAQNLDFQPNRATAPAPSGED